MLVRILYAIEFFAALTAVFIAWSQIGGQGHLDIIPWYWMLGLGVGISMALVLATRASVGSRKGWSAAVVAWLVAALLLATVMGLVTYYYHLHESDEELDPEFNTQRTSFLYLPGLW